MPWLSNKSISAAQGGTCCCCKAECKLAARTSSKGAWRRHISGRMSFAYTVIPITDTERVAPTAWLADALDTINVHLVCVWYCILTYMVYGGCRCCGSTVYGMIGRPCMVYGTAILTCMVYGAAILTCMVYGAHRCCGTNVYGTAILTCMVYGTAILTCMVCIACRCCGSTVYGMTGRPCMETGGPTGCTTSWRMTQWRS